MISGKQKAWVASLATLLSTLLAMFGIGEMPAPDTIMEASATIGSALAMSAVSWAITYKIANKPKEPPA